MLNQKQKNKLSELFIDLAKGAFLAIITIPIFAKDDIDLIFRAGILGLSFTFISLFLISDKKINI